MILQKILWDSRGSVSLIVISHSAYVTLNENGVSLRKVEIILGFQKQCRILVCESIGEDFIPIERCKIPKVLVDTCSEL